MTKSLITALFILFVVLQYKLWFDLDGICNVWRLRTAINQQLQTNLTLKNQNSILKADVGSLKNGQDAIEERARNDLGMIKKGEIFVSFGNPSN
jgi:cell division protein FtsB